MRNHLVEQVLDQDMLLLMMAFQKTLPEGKQGDLDGTTEFLKQTSKLVSLCSSDHVTISSAGHNCLVIGQDILDLFLNRERNTTGQNHCLFISPVFHTSHWHWRDQRPRNIRTDDSYFLCIFFQQRTL